RRATLAATLHITHTQNAHGPDGPSIPLCAPRQKRGYVPSVPEAEPTSEYWLLKFCEEVVAIRWTCGTPQSCPAETLPETSDRRSGPVPRGRGFIWLQTGVDSQVPGFSGIKTTVDRPYRLTAEPANTIEKSPTAMKGS